MKYRLVVTDLNGLSWRSNAEVVTDSDRQKFLDDMGDLIKKADTNTVTLQLEGEDGSQRLFYLAPGMQIAWTPVKE